MELMFLGAGMGRSASRWPEWRLGCAGSGAGRGCWAWLGRCGEGAEAGEDLGEQVIAGWQPQGEPAGVADQAGGDGDQPSAQGGDHGLSAADAVPDQPPVAGAGGEVVQ